MKISNYFFLTLFFSILLFSSCITQKEEKEVSKNEYNQEDFKAVENAILDYVEALYLVDSTRIIKSVDPKLRKIGYWYNPKEKAYRDNLEMTHQQIGRASCRERV